MSANYKRLMKIQTWKIMHKISNSLFSCSWNPSYTKKLLLNTEFSIQIFLLKFSFVSSSINNSNSTVENIFSWLPISLVKDKKRMRRHVVTGYIPTLTDLTLESQLSLFYFMGIWNIEGSFIYTNHLQSSSECTLQQMEVQNILVPLKLA